MNVFKAIFVGKLRAFGAISIILWIYLATVVLAGGMAYVMKGDIEESLGSSLKHEALREGFDMDWYGNFAAKSEGTMAESFGPWIVGEHGPISNIDRFISGGLFEIHPTLLVVGFVYLLFLAFLTGGIIDRFAHPSERQWRRARFFTSGATYFFQFVFLLIVSVAAYWALFEYVKPLVDGWVDEQVLDATEERIEMYYRLGALAFLGFVLMMISIILDYTKVSMVCRERTSSILTMLRGIGHFFSSPLVSIGLYGGAIFLYLLMALFTAVLGYLYHLYGQYYPVTNEGSTRELLITLGIGQAFIILRIFMKVWLISSHTAFYQYAFPETRLMEDDE